MTTGTSFTAVLGYWTVPSIPPSSTTEYVATWVGIGGVRTNRLIQTGTTAATIGGTTNYHAWYELIPAPPVTIPEAVYPGDAMRATISRLSTGRWTIYIRDITRGWAASGAVVYTAGIAGSVEWITERPLLTGSHFATLADYGSSRFHGLGIAGVNLSTLQYDTAIMVGTTGKVVSYPGPFYTGGTPTNHFTNYYGTPLPSIASVSPSQGPTSGGTSVTVRGSYIFPGLVRSVRFGSVSASYSVPSDDTITATAPAQASGTVNISVTTTDGSSAVTASDHYTYTAPPPPPPPPPPPAPSTGPLFSNVTGVASTPTGNGYWLVASTGRVSAHGSAGSYGTMYGKPLDSPVNHIVSTVDGKGYWLVAGDGGVFSFGDAPFYGSMGGKPLNDPVVNIASTATGGGYWLVASDGGVFTFGNAQFYGSMGGKPLNDPVVGIAATHTGHGYWEVATDGGIFSFGNAQFYGSMGGHPLNQPINGMTVTKDGAGYWMVASDGGLFAFGDGQFYGSMGGHPLNAPVMGMATDPSTGGYWMVASDGGLFSFNAPFLGAH